MEEQKDKSFKRKADRSAVARIKFLNGEEESSDCKPVVGLSGNETDTDNFNSSIHIPQNQNDILEFESFMNGIQNKLKDKENKRKKKLEKILDSIISKDFQGISQPDKIREATTEEIVNGQYDIFMSDSSSEGDDSSSDGETPLQRQKRKLKQKK